MEQSLLTSDFYHGRIIQARSSWPLDFFSDRQSTETQCCNAATNIKSTVSVSQQSQCNDMRNPGSTYLIPHESVE